MVSVRDGDFAFAPILGAATAVPVSISIPVGYSDRVAIPVAVAMTIAIPISVSISVGMVTVAIPIPVAVPIGSVTISIPVSIGVHQSGREGEGGDARLGFHGHCLGTIAATDVRVGGQGLGHDLVHIVVAYSVARRPTKWTFRVCSASVWYFL